MVTVRVFEHGMRSSNHSTVKITGRDFNNRFVCDDDKVDWISLICLGYVVPEVKGYFLRLQDGKGKNYFIKTILRV